MPCSKNVFHCSRTTVPRNDSARSKLTIDIPIPALSASACFPTILRPAHVPPQQNPPNSPSIAAHPWQLLPPDQMNTISTPRNPIYRVSRFSLQLALPLFFYALFSYTTLRNPSTLSLLFLARLDTLIDSVRHMFPHNHLFNV